MKARKAIPMDELDKVSGGCYVTVTMTIGEIVQTDRRLSSILIQSGITTVGNKSVMGMTLMEAAESHGIDPYTLENIMNDYLS